jgi:hypothetical protein
MLHCEAVLSCAFGGANIVASTLHTGIQEEHATEHCASCIVSSNTGVNQISNPY